MSDEENAREIARLTAIIENQQRARSLLKASYKWFLELLRNCMVVAALFILAQKSGSWLLYLIAAMGGAALAGYCYSQAEEAWPEPDISRMGRVKVSLSILLLELVGVGITVALVVAISKIVEVQFAVR